MTSITTEKTIIELRLIFAQHGLPEEVVSDNGPQFVSNEFAEFMHKNGIKHTLSPPYHPQSNRAAEREVRIVKEALVKQVSKGNKSTSIKHRLADFLLRYRTTPHSTTGAMPAELLMRRRLRTRLKGHAQPKSIAHLCCCYHPGIRSSRKDSKTHGREGEEESSLDVTGDDIDLGI